MRALGSIVVLNHDYARFLPDAIDSALAQTHAAREVVVVDDGSTDASRAVIEGYGRRVVAVFKENGGQDSAVNAGFAVARGDVVCFLDADDRLAPTALAAAVAALAADPRAVKVHWPLTVIDAEGRPTGAVLPAESLAAGDLGQAVRARGPGAYASSPTSGNAFTRAFLDQVLPMPVRRLRSGTADAHLSMLAPLFGTVARVADPQGAYRVHGSNQFWGRTVERLSLALEAWEDEARVLVEHLQARGEPADVGAWRRASWLHRLAAATAHLGQCLAPGAPFVLVDEDQWATGPELAGRRRLPFLERDGEYWGPPPDDETAIAELERLRAAGASALVIAWPAFWWLEHYRGFRAHVNRRFRRLSETDEVLVFDLGAAPAGAERGGP